MKRPYRWLLIGCGVVVVGILIAFALSPFGRGIIYFLLTKQITSARLVQMGIYGLLWIHPTVLALLALGWMAWLVFLISAKPFFIVEKTL
jgi:hypothetical protein